jgi:hypothetical protein
MTDTLPISHPPTIINEYLKDKIGGYFAGSDDYDLKFFPTGPTNIDDLTESFPDAVDNVFVVYDRMFRLRREAFPHIKQEQVLYYFYKKANGMKELIETIQLVQELMDRGDETAQELNEWVRQKWITQGKNTTTKRNIVTGADETFDVISFYTDDFLLPYFHEFKIFQLEEARDIIDFGTARTWAGNKMIINYDWHHPASK